MYVYYNWNISVTAYPFGPVRSTAIFHLLFVYLVVAETVALSKLSDLVLLVFVLTLSLVGLTGGVRVLVLSDLVLVFLVFVLTLSFTGLTVVL